MRFVVDSMLGKLAKWLRLLGYDTLYYRSASDRELVEIAAREGRVLLTADRQLIRSRRARTFFVSSEHWREQVHQVTRAFGFEAQRAFTRCVVCNAPLETVSRAAVRNLVPAHILETQQEFGHCPDCDRVFWKGSHFDGARSELEQILRHTQEKNPAG